jgi:hypothetical protein
MGLLLTGCIPSLHQLYTDKDVVYDPNLAGIWKDPNSAATWEFRAVKPNSYLMIYIDEKNNPALFAVHLVKLDKMLFLDIFPKEAHQLSNDFYKLHFYPVHTFVKVNQIEPSLNVQLMDIDKFTKRLTKNPTLLKHEVIQNQSDNEAGIILTASTKELQDFMLKHANDEGVFAKVTILYRTEAVKTVALTEPNKPKK